MTPTPIFGQTINNGSAVLGANANTKSDGTGTAIGTDIMRVWTAGANGGFLVGVLLIPVATSASSATAATVLRAFRSTLTSGATTGGTDTFILGELQAAAQTADQTTTQIFPLWLPINRPMNAGDTLLMTSHIVNNANTSWQATAFGVNF